MGAIRQSRERTLISSLVGSRALISTKAAATTTGGVFYRIRTTGFRGVPKARTQGVPKARTS